MERVILHSDCNSFYASVECLYNPAIRNKPVIVGGDVEQRHGIVLAKNDIAKSYGIKTGNAIWEAKQHCPDLVCVPPDMNKYLGFSRLARQIYAEYTDNIEPFGLDEAWLDVTASAGLYGDGETIAHEIRNRIKNELGITVSVGVSYNKIFAKLGSDYKKPDAVTVIPKERFKEIVWPLPVEDLLYVGKSTYNKLAMFGFYTIGDLAEAPPALIKQKLGKMGSVLQSFANGQDTSPVNKQNSAPIIKSVGNSTTTPRDLVCDDDVKITLYALCESVSERLRDIDLRCQTVQISIRDSALVSYERQQKLPYASSTTLDIFEAAFYLYKKCHNIDERHIRSIGVRGWDLIHMDDIQLSFMPKMKRSQKLDDLEKAVDTVRHRYGHFAVQRGIMLADHDLSALDAKNDHIVHPVSYF